MTETPARSGAVGLPGAFAMRLGAGLCAALSIAAGAVLALAHPLAPAVALAGFLACAATTAWRPDLGLFLLAAGAPVLDFAPWTGGLVVEEFDLLILAVAAGAHARLVATAPASHAPARARPAPAPARDAFVAAALLFCLTSMVALVRGLVATGGLRLDWFQGETDPLNAWRIFKPVAGVGLLWWPLRRLVRDDTPGTVGWLGRGMVAGVMLASLAAVAERAAYTGAFNFSGRYRTTAWFWEMHVGGAAIDAYLALATPFVAWALWNARSPPRWGLAAALALLVGYVDLTTFARGLYLAAAVSLTLLGTVLARREGGERVRTPLLRALATGAALLGVAVALGGAFAREGRGDMISAAVGLAAVAAGATYSARRARPFRRRRAASLGLALALLLEAALVLGTGDFLRERVQASRNDLGSRLGHWRAGLGLMRGTADWLAGIGLGRLPAEYAARVPGGAFPGTLRFVPGSGGPDEPGTAILSGPGRADVPGLLALTQRVAPRPGLAHRAALDVRVMQPVRLLARVCEIHLLYPRACQRTSVVLLPQAAPWRRVTVDLRGPPLSAGAWAWPRSAAFSLAVETPLASVEIRQASLLDPGGRELLANGDFSRGLAHWLPVAQEDFVPWHIDNLFLELLIERGLPACLALCACFAIAIRGLLRGAGRGEPVAPFLAAALCGALAVGLTSSVMDVPRVAFLVLLLAVFAVELCDARRRPPAPSGAVDGRTTS